MKKKSKKKPIKNPKQGRSEKPKQKIIKNKKPFHIGVICSNTNKSDVLYYLQEFVKIKEQYGSKVNFTFFGCDSSKDKPYAKLSAIEHQFIKPVSVVHYFKQLKSLDFDVLFIPLIPSNFNATSENYNKYLEAGLFGIPVIVLNIFPYKDIIIDKRNGFLLNSKEEFVSLVGEMLDRVDGVRSVGQNAKKDVCDNFVYSQEKVKLLSSQFYEKD